MLAFYSDDASLNPADVHSFVSVKLLERLKLNENEAGDGICCANVKFDYRYR